MKTILFKLISLILFCITVYGSDDPRPVQRTNPPRSKQNNPAVNSAIAEFEPALAVRATACITCHAKIQPGYITDFGYGDRYFFGNHGEGSSLGPFNGSIYGDFFGGEPNKTGFLTAEIGKRIIVPRARLDFDLSAAGSKLAGDHYRQALQATSLAEYLQALEKQKPNPASVVEKETVFIGAPNAGTIEARFGIASGSGVSRYNSRDW